MVLGLAILALAGRQANEFPLGNGLTARRQTYGSVNGMPGQPELLILQSDKVVSRLRTRDLLDQWLKSDEFWGGHTKANDFRYMDHPTATTFNALSGEIDEVAIAPGGCLVRIGLVYTAPSAPQVQEDVVLRWQKSSPDQWAVLDKWQTDQYVGKPNVRLFTNRGKLYILSRHTLFQLSGAALERRKIADLPDALGWGMETQSGAKVVFLLGSEPGLDAPQFVVDLDKGNVKPGTAAAVRDAGGFVPYRPPEQDLPWHPMFMMGGGSAGLPRSLGADHSASNWNRWIAIAAARGRTDEQRNNALFQLMNLVSDWGYGPWAVKVIQTVHQAMDTGSSTVRIAAVCTVRAWIFHWPQLVQHWTPNEKAALLAIRQDPIFRKTVYDGAQREQRNESGDQQPTLGGSWITVAPYGIALAVSGSPKAFPFFVSILHKRRDSSTRCSGAEAMGYLPLEQVRSTLLGFALSELYRSKGARDDYDLRGSLADCVMALKRAGETNFSSFLSWAGDRRFSPMARRALVAAIGVFADRRAIDALATLVLDDHEDDLVRVNGILAIAEGEDEAYAREKLANLAERLSPGPIQLACKAQLKNISMLRSSRDEALREFGFGEPGRMR